MHYLQFDREQLINLEYSLPKEILRTNKAGSYLCTTINGCNTRKYHGLLVCPIKNFGGEKHVLLSALDESIVQNEVEFTLGIRRYQGGVYEPQGHKYIQSIRFGEIPEVSYRIGAVELVRERLLVDTKEQILIRYTLKDTRGPVTLRLRPFLAFREIHRLSKANMFVNTKYREIENGVSLCLYEGYPSLHLQCSKKAEFVAVPDWYYNVEYLRELERGYDYLEDLFVPGYFEVQLKKGESIVFSAGLSAIKTRSLKRIFKQELAVRGGKDTFRSALEHAAQQFVHKQDGAVDIIAGFPWYGSITRQTFLALPGLCLVYRDPELCTDILTTYLKYLKDGFLPDSISQPVLTYNNADNALWLVWLLQQAVKHVGKEKELWVNYGAAVKEILNALRNGIRPDVKMDADGLIVAHKPGTPLTWMDSYMNGEPAVPRYGKTVEINALWYNAIAFALNLAAKSGDDSFCKDWTPWKERVAQAFVETFWSEGHGLLADSVRDGVPDWSVRPNMVIAAAMDFSPLSVDQKKAVLSVAKRKLFTPRGLRSLSPDHLRYVGTVQGNHSEREAVRHRGAVYPWLIQFFVKAYLEIHKQGGLPFVKKLVEGFEPEIMEHCVGTLSELYDGNPPHEAREAISQAVNVAGVIYALNLVENYRSS